MPNRTAPTPPDAGQRAALFPALSEGSKEKRAVSIVLACMERVPELTRRLLRGQGAPLGKTTTVQAWTEPGPVGKKGADRPDGRLEIQRGRGEPWTALIEAKISKAQLDNGQIEAYLGQARATGAHALITISNDFAVLADHHPTYRGKLPKGVVLLHWSWSSILTQCRLLTDGGEIEDKDHGWVLEHLVRFLAHPSTGVVRFDRMPASWKEVCEAVGAGARIAKGGEAALEVAGSWIQETRDLGLQLTEQLRQPVAVRLSRAEKTDPAVFVGRVLTGLCEKNELSIAYVIPDGVSDLLVRVDLRAKSITSSMTLAAPSDRKTAKARVNWLLRQLAKTPTDNAHDDVHIAAIYARRRQNTQASLSKVREDPGVLAKEDPKVCPTAFEVKLITALGRRMDGPRTIVQALEAHVPDFYSRVGQRLKPWVASAPKVATVAKTDKEGRNDAAAASDPAPEAGEPNGEDLRAGEHGVDPADVGAGAA